MAGIKITPEELKGQAAQMTSLQSQYESLFRSVASELNGMNQNWSSLLANNFVGKINSAQKGFSVIESILQTGATAALQSAKTMESVDSALAKMFGDDAMLHRGGSKSISAHGGGGKKLKKSGTKSKLAGDFKGALETQRKINRLTEKIPKQRRDLIKTLFKGITGVKGTKLNALSGSETAYSIWSKLADGKYSEAAGDFVEAIGGKGFDGETGAINWTGVKVKALGKTIKLVLDEDGYISKYAEKYNDMAVEYFLKGDVAGLVGAGAGEFVQTVGKGTVDILCQTTSSVVDGMVSKATGGILTFSSMNQAMYELVGTSPGHMFNQATKAISSGVDVIVDKGLVEGSGKIVKSIGSIVSKPASKIGSLFG